MSRAWDFCDEVILKRNCRLEVWLEVVECLPNKCKALRSIPSAAKKKKELLPIRRKTLEGQKRFLSDALVLIS
jgi:hypothetical protein